MYTGASNITWDGSRFYILDAMTFGINVYDIDGALLKHSDKVGRGPGELVQPHIAKSNTLERYLSVNVNQEGKAYKLDVDESIKSREAAVIYSYTLPAGILDWLPLPDARQFVLRQDNGELLFQVSDNDSVVSEFNLGGNIEGGQFITYFSSFLVNDGDRGRVAECMIFFPQLNIFDTRNGQVQSIAVDKAYREWESTLNNMISPDTIQYYEGATSTPEYIFATYKDVPLSRLNERGQGTFVYVFDWEGNFIYNIEVSENIDNIAYDARTGHLYCHEKTEDRIVRYDMSGILD